MSGENKLFNFGYDTNKDKICTYNADTKTSICNAENELVNNSLYWNGKNGTCYI